MQPMSSYSCVVPQRRRYAAGTLTVRLRGPTSRRLPSPALGHAESLALESASNRGPAAQNPPVSGPPAFPSLLSELRVRRVRRVRPQRFLHRDLLLRHPTAGMLVVQRAPRHGGVDAL